MTDCLQKFLFEFAAVRGKMVQISEAWQTIQSRHDYPPAVINLLGEMVGAAALLATNIKFNGSLILQIHGDGPVQLLVVECDTALRMRATAKVREGAIIPENPTLQQLVHVHGKGRFAITLDAQIAGQPPYQGIVPLDGDSIASIIETYMQQSEQLDTRLWLAADEHVIRGMLLQKLPAKTGADGLSEHTEKEEESWLHLVTLASTLKSDEMLSTDIKILQHRLFWDEEILIFAPLHPSFRCTCTREKVGNMLKMLGAEEVQEALAEQGKLQIHCDFCNQEYLFDAAACEKLFEEDSAPNEEDSGEEPSSPTLH